jgi:hypothetical protein
MAATQRPRAFVSVVSSVHRLSELAISSLVSVWRARCTQGSLKSARLEKIRRVPRHGVWPRVRRRTITLPMGLLNWRCAEEIVDDD